MIHQAARSLILVTMIMALPRTDGVAAEALPPRALARIGDHRLYHGPGIECAVLSPDGRYIASAANSWGGQSDSVADKDQEDYNRVIVLWDAVSGQRLRELRVPSGSIWHLDFSTDGQRLAAVCYLANKKSRIVIFALENGKLLRQLSDFPRQVVGLQFSTDDKRLHVSELDGPVSAWHAATGKQLRRWQPPSERALDGDKKAIRGCRGLLSPDGTVIVWEMQQRGESEDSSESVGLRIEDAATGKQLYQKEFPLGPYGATFAFSRDGKRLAASGYKSRVWETLTGKELGTVLPTQGTLALSADGRCAAIDEDGSGVRMWNWETGDSSEELYAGWFPAAACSIMGPMQLFSADGKKLLLVNVYDSTLRLFDSKSGKEGVVFGHRTPIVPRFSVDGRRLFTVCDEQRCCWEISAKQPTLLAHEPIQHLEIEYLAFHDERRLLLDRSAHRLQVRAAASGRLLCQVESFQPPHAGLFSADGSRFLLRYPGSNQRPQDEPGKIVLYEANTGKPIVAIKTVNLVGEPIFSPDGRSVLWLDNSGTVHLNDAASGKLVQTLRSSRSSSDVHRFSAALFLSVDGSQLLVMTRGHDRSQGRDVPLPMRVFHVSSGREILHFYANPEKETKAGSVSCVACSPDGRILAAAENGSGIVRLLEIASGKVRVEFAGHRHGVHGLDFAPDGKTLASGGKDNVVFHWDVTGAKSPPVASKASDNDLSSLWSDLASEDGKRAGSAIASFLRKSEASVAFLQERLRPAKGPSEKRLARLLADLDDTVFEKREAASRELSRLGERAEATLRRVLRDRPSLEMRRRIEDVLSKLEPTSPPPPETLRTLRAIEVLEHLETPAARRCLEALAKGAANARQTRDAKAALHRLANRR